MAMTVEEAQAAVAAAEQAVLDAKGKGVSAAIAASKALSAAKRDLTAAQKGVSTEGKTRTQVLQEQRAVDFTKKAEERAKQDVPVAPGSEFTIKGYDITQRPTAPPPDENYIYYYSWIGGATTGEWKLYQAPKNAANMATYGARSVGGSTQAEYGTSSSGANALINKPTPNKDKDGNIIGWSSSTGSNNAGKTEVSRTTNPDGSITITYSDGTTSVIPAPGGNTGYKVVNGVLTFNGQPFTGTYNGQTYENGKLKVSSSGNNQGDGKTITRTEYIGEGANRILRTYYSDGTISDSPAPVTTASTVVNSNVMTAGQQDVYSIMLGRLNQYNLGALAPLIRKLAIEGATESTIMLQLSEEPLYKERFKANEVRKQKGLSVLTPSQYLSLEDDYRQVLRAYGLTQFDNDAYVSQFLANDVSVSELSNRVVTAVQRVRNADPAVSNMLKNLYGIGQNDLVAYVLDPQQQFQKIERQVAASEISVAAARQGFNIGATVAEQLAAQGISQAEAQKGYATIADILPTAEKLSDIYGGQLESYRLAEGEQEVFNQLASAQRKRRALTERELASFSGQAGLGRTSLTQQTGGQF
jgi:hypothetical protein